MSLEDLTPEARDELALLARQLAENPATRKDMLRLTKKIKPDLPIPELEIEDYTRSAVDSANDRVAQLEAKLREKEATPTGYNPSAINKFDLSKYWRNPVAGARDEAAKALNELRKNPKPIGL